VQFLRFVSRSPPSRYRERDESQIYRELEIWFEDIASDLLELRFWLMAGTCPVTRRIGSENYFDDIVAELILSWDLSNTVCSFQEVFE
jgi:hypothetical protein